MAVDDVRVEGPLVETPLILDYLETREGATSGTTSGAWDDIDGADTDWGSFEGQVYQPPPLLGGAFIRRCELFLAIGNSTNYEHKAFTLVRDELVQRGSDAVLFCQDLCLEGSYLTSRVEGGKSSFAVLVDGEYIDVNFFEGVWYLKPRLPKSLREHPNIEYRGFIERQFRALRKSIQLGFSEKKWLNDPLAMESAENKPWQLAVAASSGLSVPDTVITSDPGEARRFLERVDGQAVLKMLATSPLPNRVIYTNRVDEAMLGQIERLKFTPAILQRLVLKSHELRVTVVGEDIFTARIDSQEDPRTALDWRKEPSDDNFKVSIVQSSLPEAVETNLKQFLRRLGLRFGAIDLIVTPDGEYVFLEVNPNGQWCFVQQRTGMNIAGSIANLLLS